MNSACKHWRAYGLGVNEDKTPSRDMLDEVLYGWCPDCGALHVNRRLGYVDLPVSWIQPERRWVRPDIVTMTQWVGNVRIPAEVLTALEQRAERTGNVIQAHVTKREQIREDGSYRLVIEVPPISSKHEISEPE